LDILIERYSKSENTALNFFTAIKLSLQKGGIKIFTASFSNSPESLNQFRLYGDDAKGVALKFDYDVLKDISFIRKCGLNVDYFDYAISEPEPCKYGDIELYVNQIIDKYKDLLANKKIFSTVNNSEEPFFQPELGINSFNLDSQEEIVHFLIDLCLWKSPEFATEEESRVVVISQNSTKNTDTFVKDGLLIPFYDHQFDNLKFINNLMIGPKCDRRNLVGLSNYINSVSLDWDFADSENVFNSSYS
jgi:hypothetical protein